MPSHTQDSCLGGFLYTIRFHDKYSMLNTFLSRWKICVMLCWIFFLHVYKHRNDAENIPLTNFFFHIFFSYAMLPSNVVSTVGSHVVVEKWKWMKVMKRIFTFLPFIQTKPFGLLFILLLLMRQVFIVIKFSSFMCMMMLKVCGNNHFNLNRFSLHTSFSWEM